MAVSLLFFGEQAPLPWLAASLVTLGLAVWLAERPTPNGAAKRSSRDRENGL
ncbi:MAG: hypothetical protein JNL92_12440 [Opitutaceae bacterium]|nr:hypothetical protein [Opitutaceae bacterium]